MTTITMSLGATPVVINIGIAAALARAEAAAAESEGFRDEAEGFKNTAQTEASSAAVSSASALAAVARAALAIDNSDVGGTGDAITLTTNLSLSSNPTAVLFEVAAVNTGAVTLNIDSIGATDALNSNGTAFAAGDLNAGDIATFYLNSDGDYQLASAVSAKLVPSYSNAGGSGDRAGIIRVTCSEDCLDDGNINDLIDGSTGAGTPEFLNNDNPADHWIAFDFGAAVLITEAKLYQDSTNNRQHGTWKWQGSNGYASWTDIGSSFTLGGVPPQTQASLSGNQATYRWYRLRGVSGAMKPDPLYQFEFKIAGDLGDLGSEGSGDGLATTLLLEEGEDVPAGYYFTGDVIRGRKLVAKEIDPADFLQAGDYWWDFSDSDVVTKDGSNNISQVDDKGPSKNHLTVPSGATAPTHDVQIAGVDAADFSNGEYMRSLHNVLDGGACEVFAALLPLNYTTTNRTLLQQAGVTGQTRNFTLARLLLAGASTNMTGYNTNNTYPILTKTVCIHTWRIPGTGSQTVYANYNGVEVSEVETVVEGLTTNWNIGEQSFPGKPIGAYIGEILVFNRALSTSERAKIQGYIERKWWKPTPVKKYHIVGAIGQSNMRGAYGPIDLSNAEDQPDKRIAMWGDESPQEGKILLAEHPLHHEDINVGTIGMAMAYAKDLLATLPDDEGVLIVGHAIPGSGFISPSVQWNEGNDGYTEFVAKMNAAVALGHELHSVIWHQGELEAKYGTTTYEANLDAMITAMRGDITGASALPFVLGTLGDFINTGSEAGNYPNVAAVNSIINDTPNRLSNVAVADATGLTDGGDDLHFDAASLRTFGGTYFTAYGTI